MQKNSACSAVCSFYVLMMRSVTRVPNCDGVIATRRCRAGFSWLFSYDSGFVGTLVVGNMAAA